MEKVCFKCLESKPLGEFYKHKAMADGRLGKCKLCTKRDVSRHRDANLERARDYDRARYRRDREKRIAVIKAAYRKYPERLRARRAVHNAIRDKRLFRPSTCGRCGGPGPIEASHNDYSKPLEVEWLCRSCHVKKDRPRGYDT